MAQKLAPAEKIAPTGWHGWHVFATLGRCRVENLLRHPSQTNLEGRAANLKNPVVKTYQKFSSESAENAPLIKFGGDGNI